MKQVSLPEVSSDFVIIYKGERIPVSKVKIAMYAANFKDVADFANKNEAQITDSAPLATFLQFAKAVQGEPFTISPQNINDIQRLAQIWGAETVLDKTKEYMQKSGDIKATIDSLILNPDTEISQQLEDSIASQIDAAIAIPSFASFKLGNIVKCLKNPNLRIKDYHNMYRFLMNLLSVHHRDASPAFSCIDLTRLTPREALDVLQNEELDKSYIGESAAVVCVRLIKESDDLKKQMTILSGRLEEIEQYNFQDEFSRINAAFKEVENRIEKNIPRASAKNQKINANLEKKVDQKLAMLADGIAKKITEIETKVKKQDRAQTAHFKEALDKLKTVELGIDPIKGESREMRRSIRSVLQKQVDIETALKNDAFLPVDSIQLPFAGHSFDGILAYLTDTCQGNVHEKNVVLITSSSVQRGAPQYVASRNPQDYFSTENKPSSWIKFDFQDRRVIVNNYSIKSSRLPDRSTHLKSWAIEGSNDNEEWSKIDRRTTSVLNGPNKFQTFPATSPDGQFRYIRLRITDINYRGDNVLCLQSIEFFGALLKAEAPSSE